MSESLRSWWRANSTFILFLVTQAVGFIIWGVHLEGRVSTIEQRGSPQVDKLADRVSRVEERQANSVQLLKDNSVKMDQMLNELYKHEMREK